MGAQFLSNLLTWLGDWQPHVRQALKTTIAACLAYFIAYSLVLPQAFWAAVVAIFVTQANIGASLGLALDWFLGSLIGAVVGGGVAVLVGHAFALQMAGLAATVLVMAYFAGVSAANAHRLRQRGDHHPRHAGLGDAAGLRQHPRD